MFLEYRNRAFQGAFHANPDYMLWYGWAAMKESLQKIKDESARIREEAEAQKGLAKAMPTAIGAGIASLVALALGRIPPARRPGK